MLQQLACIGSSWPTLASPPHRLAKLEPEPEPEPKPEPEPEPKPKPKPEPKGPAPIKTGIKAELTEMGVESCGGKILRLADPVLCQAALDAIRAGDYIRGCIPA